MANEMAARPEEYWKRSRAIQGLISQQLERDLREYRDNLAEARVELDERNSRIIDLDKAVLCQQEEISTLDAALSRARGVMRNQHLALKPAHRHKLNHRDPSLKVGDKNRLIDAWCTVCAQVLGISEGGDAK